MASYLQTRGCLPAPTPSQRSQGGSSEGDTLRHNDLGMSTVPDIIVLGDDGQDASFDAAIEGGYLIWTRVEPDAKLTGSSTVNTAIDNSTPASAYVDGDAGIPEEAELGSRSCSTPTPEEFREGSSEGYHKETSAPSDGLLGCQEATGE